MNIALDIDGTISDCPDFFSLVSRMVIACGGEVHIVTYRPPSRKERLATEEELLDWGIEFTQLHMAPPSVTPAQCPNWKASVVLDKKCEVVFEDQPENLASMPEGVVRMWVCNPEVFNLSEMIEALKP